MRFTRRRDYTGNCAPLDTMCSRNRAMSWVGALPNKRPYSRLNWETLRYPTRELGDFDTVRFAEKLARKDIGLATELARECGVPLKIGNLVEQDHIIEAMSRGWGERDSTVPFALQGERAGVKVRKAKA